MKKVTKTSPVHIVTYTHGEGRLLHYTLKSVLKAARYSNKQGIKAEITVLVSSPTAKTADFIDSISLSTKKEVGLFIDKRKSIAQAKIELLNSIKNPFISFIKAGDLMSENWIVVAQEVANLKPKDAIIYPECIFSFGSRDRVQTISNNDIESFVLGNVLEPIYNYPLFLCRREIAVKYLEGGKQKVDGQQHGLEEVISAEKSLRQGTRFFIAPQTLHADRWVDNDPRHRLPERNYLVNANPLTELNSLQVRTKDEHKPRLNAQLARASVFASWLHTNAASRKLRKVNGRVDMYIGSLHNAALHALRPAEKIEKFLPQNWITSTISSLHETDLDIFLSKQLQAEIEVGTCSPTLLTKAYLNLVNKIGSDTDYLYILPYVKNGGAERELNYLINTVIKFKPNSKLALLTTEPEDSPWIDNISSEVKLIQPDDAFHQLSAVDKAYVLGMACLHTAPRKIHIVNSVPAFHMLEKYASFISKKSKLFITVFSIDRTPEGRHTHIFTRTMLNSIDHVTRVFTDNNAVVNQLCELMGINKNIFSVHYQPNQSRINDVTVRRLAGKPLRVLWAGRLDRQKRPDLLVKIADICNSENIEVIFDVWGESAHGDTRYEKLLRPDARFVLHGGYQGGITTLPTANYDLFMMTSEWEGMPNILLEATAEGLPIIAPNVGGISEFIKNGQTGQLISGFSDAYAYVSALKAYIKDPQPYLDMVARAQRLLRERHSQQSYEHQVLKEEEYFYE